MEDLPYAEDVGEDDPPERKRRLRRRSPRASRPGEDPGNSKKILIVALCCCVFVLCFLSALGSYVTRQRQSEPLESWPPAESEPPDESEPPAGPVRPVEWCDFTPPGGGFTVSVPTEPVQEPDEAMETPGATLRIRHWNAQDAGEGLSRTYSMVSMKIPPALFEKATVRKFLDGYVEDSVKRFDGGRLVYAKSIALGKIEGRESQVLTRTRISDKTRLRVTTRFFLTKKGRLFSIAVYALDGIDSSREIERFFGSFRIQRE
ncbi:hypothetical protein HY251_03515 [bacterium]|nr:hypothetical protein [bacterium]